MKRRDILATASDGRFDIIATFLAGFRAGTVIAKPDMERYWQVRHTIWEIFTSALSEDQRAVYDQAKLLRDFRLPVRGGYVTALMHTYGQMQTQTEVLNLLRSIWPIDGDEAIPYEGQFGPPQVDESRAIRVARAMLTMGDLRLSDRYAFQNEMKAFGSILVGMGRSKEGLRFFRQLRRWYPHDWYFAYLLAEADRAAGHKLRAVMALFQILRRWDARSIYSGKWIEIQCHLLLAQLYQDLGKSRERDWSYHQRLEHEFVVAAGLADLDMPDLGPGDFETEYASHPETVGEFEKRLELEHKELGYEVPSFLSVDAKRSRAIVHHRYSDYLLGQIHREFDVIKHESIAFQLLPLDLVKHPSTAQSLVARLVIA